MTKDDFEVFVVKDPNSDDESNEGDSKGFSFELSCISPYKLCLQLNFTYAFNISAGQSSDSLSFGIKLFSIGKFVSSDR